MTGNVRNRNSLGVICPDKMECFFIHIVFIFLGKRLLSLLVETLKHISDGGGKKNRLFLFHSKKYPRDLHAII